ncbi:unnamed protein product [Ascophyllum nodosum]
MARSSHVPGDGQTDPRDFEKKTQDELDDILNSALDELEDDEDFAAAGTDERTQGAGYAESIKAVEDEEKDQAAKAFQTLLDDFSNPQIAESLEEAFRRLGAHAEGEELLQESLRAATTAERGEAENRLKTGKGAADDGQKESQDRSSCSSTAVEEGSTARRTESEARGSRSEKAADAARTARPDEYGFGEGATDMDRTIFRTLEMLSKSGAEMEGQEAANIEAGGEDIMREMMGEFEKMGEKEDYNGVMDNIMQQLLSRELMYDPIKQICDKYPVWLATHRKSLAPSDYQRYGKQYQSFQRVLAVYETEPDNFPRLMELMQDMQEHGQVPAEIIKELAPGLEFNAEGSPIMPNVGEGMMPNLPGFANAEGADGQCCIS